MRSAAARAPVLFGIMTNDVFRNREVVRANNGAIGFSAGQTCIPNMGLFSNNSVQQQHHQLKESKR
jgi:hypothetical protein